MKTLQERLRDAANDLGTASSFLQTEGSHVASVYFEKSQKILKYLDSLVSDRKPQERYMLYVRGFGDGAKCSAMRHESDLDYARGYSDGRSSRSMAVNDFCREIGYTPTVLRNG